MFKNGRRTFVSIVTVMALVYNAMTRSSVFLPRLNSFLLTYSSFGDIDSMATVAGVADSSSIATDYAHYNDTAIFYHIYIADGKHDLAYEIFREQMEQIGSSYVGKIHRGSSLLPIYYNSIGMPINATFVDKVCSDNGLSCRHIKHYETGFETLTLQNLWEYCHDNIHHTVIYLPSKGSFHPSEGNNMWRRTLTQQATSEYCVTFKADLLDVNFGHNFTGHNQTDKEECNVCGNGFQVTWGPLFLGNMFSARCSYVAKLVPPNVLEDKANIAYTTRHPKVTFSTFRLGAFSKPSGRYVAEHFIGTHPDIVPCDGNGSLLPKGNFPNSSNLRDMKFNNVKQMLQNGHHVREWFLLGGLLWRWHVMYNTTASSNSWVYSYFPDGENWQKAVKEYGHSQAYQRRIDEFLSHLDKNYTASV